MDDDNQHLTFRFAKITAVSVSVYRDFISIHFVTDVKRLRVFIMFNVKKDSCLYDHLNVEKIVLVRLN